MSKTIAKWEKDEGYSCCKTARFGNIAVVICPPEYGSGWGYQAFDEDICSCEPDYEEYGFKSEAEVINYVESCML